MNVTIIETNESETLSIIDPQSGCDWTNDLLGNHGDLPDYNEETDNYHMTKESFDWWNDLISRLEVADDRCAEIKKCLDYEQSEEFAEGLADACNCDLENQPEVMQQFCDEWEESHKSE